MWRRGIDFRIEKKILKPNNVIYNIIYKILITLPVSEVP